MKFLRVGAPTHESFGDIVQGGYADAHATNVALLRDLVPGGGRVLDVGAWHGAFSARLKTEGFAVEACDLDPREFRADGVICHAVDLNSAASRDAFLVQRAGAYDVVAALEIIEHVEDPWSFLRFAARLARPGGHILLTTPNPANFYSRLTFLTRGHMHQFAPSDESYGHINPLTPQEVDLIARHLGLQTVRREPVEDLPFVWLQPNIAATIKWTVAAALSLVTRGDRQGWCMRWVLRVPPASAT